MAASPEVLWRHRDPASTQMYLFKNLIERNYGLKLETYEDLRQWSTSNISLFWGEVWDFTGIIFSCKFEKVSISPLCPIDSNYVASLLNRRRS